MAILGRRLTGSSRIVHSRRPATDRGQSAGVPWPQQHVAFAEVDAGRSDMTAGRRSFGDRDIAHAIHYRIFLDHDRVGAFGYDPPGKSLTASPDGIAPHDGRPAGISPIRSTRAPSARSIGGSRCIAVHCGHRLGRLGPQCNEIAREHPVICRVQRDHFFGQRLGAGEDSGLSIGNRNQCHVENSLLGQYDNRVAASVLADSGRRGKTDVHARGRSLSMEQ